MDIVAIGLVWPFRVMRYVAARMLYGKSSAFAWFLRHMGAIAAGRDGADLSPISESIRLLNEGKTVTIFPEGRISNNGELLPFLSGAATIAVKTDATIVPMYQHGERGFFKKGVTVVGEPFKLSEMYDLSNLTSDDIFEINDLFMAKISSLKEAIPQKVLDKSAAFVAKQRARRIKKFGTDDKVRMW